MIEESFTLPLPSSGRFGGNRFRPFEGGSVGLCLGQFVKLMELGLQELLLGQASLVFCDQGRGDGTAQGVLDDLMILRRAEQHANRWLLVRFLHVTVKRF